MADKHGFPQTHHSMINRIQIGDNEKRLLALTEFAEGYRQPLIEYLVKCLAIKQQDAEDLVQQFFLDKIMTGKVLELANDQGRFRNALRKCLYHFFVDKNRIDSREKIERYFDADVDENSSSLADPIDLVWATALFRTALIRMKAESKHWDLFFDRVLTQPPLPYDQVIEKYECKDPAHASNLLMTAKRQFNRILNECVGSQSYLSGEFENQDYKHEIELLSKLLKDSKMIGEVVHSIDDAHRVVSPQKTIHSHSILSDHVLFIDESPEHSWNRSDIEAMSRHFLEQPVARLINDPSYPHDGTLRQRLFGNPTPPMELAEAKSLKDVFNERGKAKSSSVPLRIDVMLTFTMIAKFVTLDGEVEDITSMRRDVLTQRLEQLLGKDWLSDDIRDLLGQAIAKLLS